ncbi:glucose and ribitol dehydrogenase [Spinacia oleracea]|uniref:Glucose and ribitol dehydrogenase n=1 Tax=Spinacia oleracea TaxID=3562 RepID=A0A9R0J6Y0_SPIOL|nr:glucose and ribitol dehydrogenase-like [Spinacia oleracea]
MTSKGQKFPPQTQEKPGKQFLMNPLPKSVNPQYKPSKKLHGKVALVTGGDSGIGRAVCYYFALEGATVAFTYVKGPEDKDAEDALELIRKAANENEAGEPIAIPVDFSRGEDECKDLVEKVVKKFKRIDVLVNNAGTQYFTNNIEDISEKQIRLSFEINFFAPFFLAKHSLKYMKEGGSIINTVSVVAYRGEEKLVDYSCTKGALVTFTRSLGVQLINRGIRVNGVAPGPIWTPLHVASLPVERIVSLGSYAPMDRAAEPFEVAPSYVFLASNECSSYFTGQVLHPNGGLVVNA